MPARRLRRAPSAKQAGLILILVLIVAGAAVAAVITSHSSTGHQGQRSGPDTTPASSAAAIPTAEPVPAGARDCASRPSKCGFPDATNTGAHSAGLRAVPEQVDSGPGWHWDKRGWVDVDGDGAVFSGYVVHANVNVTGRDVVVSDNVISFVDAGGFGVSLRHTVNATVRNNTINSPEAGAGRLLVGVKNVYGDERGTAVIGNDISHTSTGVQMDSGLIANNYIHDMGFITGDHLNGTTSNAGRGLLRIFHNTIFNAMGQTDAVSLFEDFGVQQDRVIDRNLLAGGGYTIYGGANPGGAPTSRISITGNRISRMYFPKGGYYGPLAAWDGSGSGNVWQGNVWDDTGLPIEA